MKQKLVWFDIPKMDFNFQISQRNKIYLTTEIELARIQFQALIIDYITISVPVSLK